ncbi:disease resistance protein RGA2-like [Zingiber officinale]|uniref:disease resistance protein RGA2-like n=1 Tax=Zingiber officinale TaxID=94328 RepID=UPI001C4D4F61|nr:disease resistance protein RGA2-like [Zingiber officinale]
MAAKAARRRRRSCGRSALRRRREVEKGRGPSATVAAGVSPSRRRRAPVRRRQPPLLLLVLDDVWNEELKLWNPLKRPLMSAKVGKVIVTTRLDSVARIMQTTDPLILESLPFDMCWLLFKQIAFTR